MTTEYNYYIPRNFRISLPIQLTQADLGIAMLNVAHYAMIAALYNYGTPLTVNDSSNNFKCGIPKMAASAVTEHWKWVHNWVPLWGLICMARHKILFSNK